MKDDFKPATWQALERLIKDAQPVDVVAKEVGISPWTVYSARSTKQTWKTDLKQTWGHTGLSTGFF